MIAKYNDNEVHAKCLDVMPTSEYGSNGNPPKGLTINDWAGGFMGETEDGHYSWCGGVGYGLSLQVNANEAIKISIPLYDIKDEKSQLVASAGSVYVYLKRYKNGDKQNVVYSETKRLAFADEIPKAACPFPIGFSFMLTTAYTDATISDLKAAYPDTNWSYTQVAGLYNTNVIRRTK